MKYSLYRYFCLTKDVSQKHNFKIGGVASISPREFHALKLTLWIVPLKSLEIYILRQSLCNKRCFFSTTIYCSKRLWWKYLKGICPCPWLVNWIRFELIIWTWFILSMAAAYGREVSSLFFFIQVIMLLLKKSLDSSLIWLWS